MGKSSLGELELMVLLAVMQLGEDEAHTLAIVDAIHQRTGRAVQRAAVYVTLQRLEKKSLVASWLAAPRPERGGKGRRHVRAEPAGVQAVRETRAALQSMWQGLEPALGEP
ncbi:MAG: PadR family transcriptional regulator [Acidobacteriota bacterium]